MAEIILPAIDQKRVTEPKRSDHLSRICWHIAGSPGLGRSYLVLILARYRVVLSGSFVPDRWSKGTKTLGTRVVRSALISILQNDMTSFAIFGRNLQRVVDLCLLRGTLSNHDDDDNKNLTNLHIWQWKTIFLHALHVQFSSFDIL